MYCKYIFFFIHFLFIIVSLLGWQYYPILIIHVLTIISWYYNHNRCILTQIEDYLFGETLIDFYLQNCAKQHNLPRKGPYRFVVPKTQRYLLYSCFIMGLLYFYV